MLEVASDQSILLRKSLSVFSYSLQHCLLPCHSLFYFIACFPITFYTIHYLFINQIQDMEWDWELFTMFSHLPTLQSFSCHVPPSLSPSTVACLLYNPIDMQCTYEKILSSLSPKSGWSFRKFVAATWLQFIFQYCISPQIMQNNSAPLVISLLWRWVVFFLIRKNTSIDRPIVFIPLILFCF